MTARIKNEVVDYDRRVHALRDFLSTSFRV